MRIIIVIRMVKNFNKI